VSNAAAKVSVSPLRIGEYEIVAELGRGAMGSVYVARDTLLERDVALKLIAADSLDAETKTLFFHEARALARVSHPNVIAVHRVGEIDRQAYLVTELVRGGSLDDLAKPVPWSRALVLGIGIARGLAAAHKRRVLHRDVTPANVMLGDEGEVKLVDFGLAKVLGEAEAAPAPRHAQTTSGLRPSPIESSAEIAGTPLYMAPEVLLGERASVQSDIYGVGAVLYELVAGVAPRDTLPERIPLSEWISAEPDPVAARAGGAVDARFARVIHRCLARAPADRFASAEALAEALEIILEGEETGEVTADNPYRGLEPFEAEHRGIFFGRDEERRAVQRRLEDHAMVIVAGDSGVGKSSLCKAGVLPGVAREAVDRGGALKIVSLVPGLRPLDALKDALAGLLTDGVANLAELLESDQAAVYREATRALAPKVDLLVFVDQLEECCTISDPQQALSFGEALVRLCAGPRIRVLATLRGDFITQLAALGSLGAALSTSLFLLRPLTEEGIRAAIVRPALRKGISFESDELVDELVRGAAETAGGLPLLEFALTELWAARDEAKGIISRHALRTIGSVAGALARHADAVVDALSPQERVAARHVLLKLAHTAHTRARRTFAELSGDRPEMRRAIDALVRGRLIVARGIHDDRVYEVAHEALLRDWQTLRRWIEETKEQGQLLQEIEQAAELWDRRGRREDETWAGEALAQSRYRVEKWRLDLPPLSREFLDAGEARQRRGLRRRRLLFGATTGALVLLAAVSTAAAVAFSEKEKQAIRQQQQIRLAAADMGEFDLVLEPFDWDAARQVALPAPVPPALDVRLHAVSSSDTHSPGRPYGTDDWRRAGRRLEERRLTERIEARSGPAILEVTGRGEGCASSWVYLQRLPGYRDRAAREPAVLRIPVPSCQATREGMVEIPAGEYVRSYRAPDQNTSWADERVDLPAYFIDRTEVTRAAFASYASLEGLTGDGAAHTSYLDLDRAGGERLPIVGVNSHTAARYCRFLGKELPSVDQWLKAMRGGLTVRGAANPDPKRDMPWTIAPKHPANLQDEDGYSDLAPVGAFPADTSPYGVVDLGGNVSEWSRDEARSPKTKGLIFILGANWDTPPAYAHWRNMRPDGYLDFTIGIRCVRE
jgi:formylglycine-generating enzyme required for sulfatase activity